MIRFEQVFKRYPGSREALSGVSVSMDTGEMAFLTGRSGAGKSTMLKLIGLLERPTRGQVIVNGRNIGGIKRRQIPAFRRQIGMVFQDHKLLNDRSVFDNVALPLVVAGLGLKESGKR
ncbi:MAG: ATP-binding cassette domain-containing protein, partial [Chromatiales bacterium]|nr:ATP-binding cassette domain-containing protein [Chromatiales bacterium]